MAVLRVFKLIIYYFSISKCNRNSAACKNEDQPCCYNQFFQDDECVPCPVGYFGMNCSEKCPKGTFGKLCNKECLCPEASCHHVNGCQENGTEQQLRGFCDDGDTERVDSRPKRCCANYHHIDGICTRCPVGYFGVHCSGMCPYPSYGDTCGQTCVCSEDQCHHITGCNSSLDCPPGYFGEHCSNPCDYPWYGRACRLLCLCKKKWCHYVNGCHSDDSSHISLQFSTEKNNFENTKKLITSSGSVTVIITGSLLTFSVVIALFYQVFKLCKRIKKQSSPAMDIEISETGMYAEIEDISLTGPTQPTDRKSKAPNKHKTVKAKEDTT